ncbi:MAG: DUF362 domain-containing protein [Acidobacteria bacterium]|jgi:uncharacterized protein (DUF362 family)|nr:DUF362 domain-containing protein [Acidobacteriota bacterium]
MIITRREFGKKILSSSIGLSAAFYLPGMSSQPLMPLKESIVALALSPKLLRLNNDVDKAVASEYLSRAMIKITGVSSSSAAWKSIFLPGEAVGIKLSCLPGPPLSSAKGIVMAIVEGLLSAGIKEEHIYIWDRTGRELEKAGFKFNNMGVRIVGTDYYAGGGYSPNVEISGSVGTCFSKIIEMVDALISVPVLKDHDIAGVSIGMKNFYGAIHNPNKYHGNHCDPYVADICNHPLIKNKWRLTVCDASRVQVHNGPAFFPKYAWEYGGMLVSRDPVALDYLGWQIIEKKRKELGLKSLAMENREPSYIMSAAKLGLGNAGINCISKIEV